MQLSGVERPLAAGHEKLRNFQPEDRLVSWACADPLATEEALIRRWRPRFNEPNGGEPYPGCGGRWKNSERSAGANQYPPVPSAVGSILDQYHRE
jgi:hypothetical protein